MKKGTKRELAVLIGRFQPFHAGHLALVKEALVQAERLLVLVGSEGCGPGLRNPWSFAERLAMMEPVLAGLPVEYRGLRDSDYCFADWCRWVTGLVEEVQPEDCKVVLIGHTKDETSFYLEHFPQWSYQEIAIQESGIGATSLRELYLGKGITDPGFRVPVPVADFLSGWRKEGRFEWLQGERQYWNTLRDNIALEWDDGRLHELLLVVCCRGCVLFLQPGIPPGAGLYRLPGCFLEKGVEPDQRGHELFAGLELGNQDAYSVPGMKSWDFKRGAEDGKGDVMVHVRIIDLGMPRDDVFIQTGCGSWLRPDFVADKRVLFAEDHARILGHCLANGLVMTVKGDVS